MFTPCLGLATLLIVKKCGPIYMHLQIIDSDGNPLSDSEIHVTECRTGRKKHFISCIHGQMHLTVRQGYTYEIQVNKKGFSSNFLCVCLCCSNWITICLKRIKGKISGTIYHHKLDNKHTLTNALVGLYSVKNHDTPRPLQFTYSDQYGRFVFYNLEMGDYIIKAIK